MEEHVNKMGDMCPVNIPLQMIAVTDTNGRMSPLRFRFETEDHLIEVVNVERTVSRDESNYVGIKEKRFVCVAVIDGVKKSMEIRYTVNTQKWRIFQFLS